MAQSYNNYFTSDNSLGTPSSNFTLARVESVVYGPYLEDGKTRDPNYNDITDIGKITYVIVNSAQYQSSLAEGNPPARPFFSYMHQYPVKWEYVYIIPGPGLNLNDKAGDIDYYYLPPIKLWGAANHNAHPPMDLYSLYINASAPSYIESQQGSTRNNSATPMDIPLGYDFIEHANVKTLIPFVGDILFEGRNGSSIRFGSTTNKPVAKFNTWSDAVISGDLTQVGKPIMIIRNGQGNPGDKNGATPTVENINIDNSSIYLTAGQQIDIADLANFPLTSWDVTIQQKITAAVSLTTPPTANNTFSAQQQDSTTLPNTGAPSASPTST